MNNETTTYDAAVQAVEDVLFSKEDGKSRLEREMETAFYRGIGRWLIGGGLAVVVAVVGIYYQVQSNTERINDSLTKDQAALITQKLDALKESVDQKNIVINEIDKRLREAGF